jgi:hypothetical protein
VGLPALYATSVTLAQSSPAFETSPTPFIVLFAVGFGIGVFGHLAGSRVIVAFGIAIVFVATLVLPIALSISN